MVLAYYPQHARRSLGTNSNNPPQGVGGVVPPPAFDLMAYEDLNTMGYEPAESWFNILWQERIPLTVNSGQVPSTQTNLPTLINKTFPDLIGAVEGELRFAGIDDVQLEYAIESFDNSTGELTAWVNKPTISDGDIIYIYFDNPAAFDEQDSTKVWESPYLLRYDMKLDGGLVKDSTINGNDGVVISAIDAPGKIARELEFSNPGSSVIVPSTISETGDWAVMLWGNRLPPNLDQEYFIDFQSGRFTIGVLGDVDFEVFDGAIFHKTGVPINDGVSHMIIVSKDAGDVTVYVDGNLTNTITALNLGGDITLGSRFTEDDNFLEGGIDEVAILNEKISADRARTLFNSQNDSDIFYSTGAKQSVSEVTTDTMGYEG